MNQTLNMDLPNKMTDFALEHISSFEGEIYFTRIKCDSPSPFGRANIIEREAIAKFVGEMAAQPSTEEGPCRCMIKCLSNTFLMWGEPTRYFGFVFFGYVIIDDKTCLDDDVVLVRMVETFYRGRGVFGEMMNRLQTEYFQGRLILPDDISPTREAEHAWHKHIDKCLANTNNFKLVKAKVKKYVKSVDWDLITSTRYTKMVTCLDVSQ